MTVTLPLIAAKKCAALNLFWVILDQQDGPALRSGESLLSSVETPWEIACIRR